MEVKEFFSTRSPYNIAKKITKGDDLYNDLVAHVYMIMIDKPKPDNIGANFASIAYRQYNWHNSEFNRLYRPVFTSEFDESFMSIEEEEIIHMDEFKEHLHKYLKSTSDNPVEWFTKEIAKMVMAGKTYRQIQSDTKVNTSQITKSIKQFKHDLYNSFHSRFDCDHSPGV